MNERAGITISHSEWSDIKKRLSDLEEANLKLQLQLTKAQGDQLRNDAVTEVLQYFDFKKVHVAMEALNWTWKSGDYEYHPTLDQLKESAIRSMKCAIESAVRLQEPCFSGTGGFIARAEADGSVQLDFVVESWNTQSDNEDETQPK